MRVLQIMVGARQGGAEAFFMRLVPALARAGLEQRVVIRPHAERIGQLRDAGIETVAATFGRRFDLTTRLQLRREIGRFRPDVVMTWMNRATQMCPRGRFVHVARLGGYYDTKYYRRCDHLVANTEDIVRHLVDSDWPPERVHYVPNFVNDSTAAAAARKPLFTPPGAPVVLALGRLHRNKAFDVLIRAMRRVPDAYLWIAGEGPERAELQALAASLGVKPRVRFLGWRDDSAALFAAADVFVCPSRHEPLGNVVIEAWAHRVPVVAADSEGPGTLLENQANGLLVPVEDAETMGAAVRHLLDHPDLAGRLAAAGRAAFEAQFTEAKVVARYLEFFQQVSGKPVPGVGNEGGEGGDQRDDRDGPCAASPAS